MGLRRRRAAVPGAALKTAVLVVLALAPLLAGPAAADEDYALPPPPPGSHVDYSADKAEFDGEQSSLHFVGQRRRQGNDDDGDRRQLQGDDDDVHRRDREGDDDDGHPRHREGNDDDGQRRGPLDRHRAPHGPLRRAGARRGRRLGRLRRFRGVRFRQSYGPVVPLLGRHGRLAHPCARGQSRRGPAPGISRRRLHLVQPRSAALSFPRLEGRRRAEEAYDGDKRALLSGRHAGVLHAVSL